MSADALAAIDRRLRRAALQAQALAREIELWSIDHGLSTRAELSENRCTFKLILHADQPAPVNDWGLSLGEWAHNLRSILDNLAYGLAELHESPPLRPRQISFPIYKDADEFARKCAPFLNQIGQQDADLIKRLQPFQRPPGELNGDPLIHLAFINNQDKHRQPAVAWIVPQRVKHKVEITYVDAADMRPPPDVVASTTPLDVGATILQINSDVPLERVSGAFTVEAQAVTAISVDKHYSLADLLEGLTNYIGLVIEQFRPRFLTNK